MALRLAGKMPVPRPELPARLMAVVYLPPAGKGDFFQPGVRGRAVGVYAVAPRVGDVGVGVAGGAVGVLDGAGDVAPGVVGVLELVDFVAGAAPAILIWDLSPMARR